MKANFHPIVYFLVAYDDVGLARIAPRGGAVVLHLGYVFVLMYGGGLGQDYPRQDNALSAGAAQPAFFPQPFFFLPFFFFVSALIFSAMR